MSEEEFDQVGPSGNGHDDSPGHEDVDFQIELAMQLDVAEDFPVAEAMRLRGAVLSGQNMMENGIADLLSQTTIVDDRLSVGIRVFRTAGVMAIDAAREAIDRWLADQGMPVVSLYQVESSNLAAMGWAAQEGESVAVVEYLNGGVYAYDGVPEEVFRDWWEAPSRGVFLASEIKGNYPFRRLA